MKGVWYCLPVDGSKLVQSQTLFIVSLKGSDHTTSKALAVLVLKFMVLKVKVLTCLRNNSNQIQ